MAQGSRGAMPASPADVRRLLGLLTLLVPLVKPVGAVLPRHGLNLGQSLVAGRRSDEGFGFLADFERQPAGRAPRPSALKCGEPEHIDWRSVDRERCPETCPFLVEDVSRLASGPISGDSDALLLPQVGEHGQCWFVCVKTAGHCALLNPNASVADADAGLCRPCMIAGCEVCNRDGTDTCLECAPGYWLARDGAVCRTRFDLVWQTGFAVLAVVVVLLACWVLHLSYRPVTNKEGLQHGSHHRDRSRLTQGGTNINSSTDREDFRTAREEDEEEEEKGYAVKVIDANRLATIVGAPLELVRPRLQREVEILQLLDSHQNIVRLHYSFLSEASNKIYLVTEYVRGGDLFNYIVSQGRAFTEAEARTVFAQVVDAVGFCHSQGIAHRDVKLENILVSASGHSLHVKLCDYGQAKVLSHEGMTDTSQTLTTTPAYTAPEVKRAVDVALPYDAFKADSFGLGVVLFGMLCNALPDATKGQSHMRQRAWSTLSEQAKDLIQGLLCSDPVKRLAAGEVRQHPWMRSTPISPSSNCSSKSGKAGCEVTRTLSCGGLVIQRVELQAVLTGQNVIASIQRERGAACWALNSNEGELQFAWRKKFTDERIVEVAEHVSTIIDPQFANHSAWGQFNEALHVIRTEAQDVRQRSQESFKQRDDSFNQEDDFWEVFQGYTSLIGLMINAMTNLVHQLIGDSEVPSATELRYRWLQSSAEQVGRERAFLCGHLDRPETLRLSPVVMELSKIIGARQVLVGSSPASSAVHKDTVVSSESGLLSVLGLAQAPLIEMSALMKLEAAESQVLNARRGGAPAAAETFHLTTGIIDSLHQHILLLFSRLFSKERSLSQLEPIRT
mmetsp:Transcript_26074/g.77710  ORF Transcript_26074/g.77710 Transcript_26074/m.77710 type:complete len:845 (-) Transcript_26074:32-2566(-)